jgi:iron-sulfur cluster repair protein YtfE (RIC family)
MDETLRLIDQLIAEHKNVGEKTQSLEKAVNDVRLLSGLKEVGDEFVRGAVPQGEEFKNLAQMVNIVSSWLDSHFEREENILKPAVVKYGNNRFVKSIDSLLFEHSELRDRMLHARVHIDELMAGGLDPVRHDAAVRDLRVHISHSRKLFETHAAQENHFLNEFRKYLEKSAREKEKQS